MSPEAPPPCGSSCASAWVVASGTAPCSLISTGSRSGGPARTEAAMPACQSSSGTRVAGLAAGGLGRRRMGREGGGGGVARSGPAH